MPRGNNVTRVKKKRVSYEKLERLLEECTAELAMRNRHLESEIANRKRIEERLQKTGDELEAKSHTLEKASMTLEFLLNHLDEKKQRLEEDILTNVKKLIMPCIERLKTSALDIKQMGYVRLIEANLNDILSSFSYRLLSKFTPREIQVINLIRDGKITKEIADLLHVSPSAVQLHRHHIRRKLGLVNKRLNLRSHLLGLDSL